MNIENYISHLIWQQKNKCNIEPQIGRCNVKRLFSSIFGGYEQNIIKFNYDSSSLFQLIHKTEIISFTKGIFISYLTVIHWIESNSGGYICELNGNKKLMYTYDHKGNIRRDISSLFLRDK